MENILDWGVNIVLAFQQLSPVLDLPFTLLTFLGEEEFFLLLLPFVYWCLDRHTGVWLTILLLCSNYVSAVAKVLLDQPRPFQYDARVKMISEASGGGLPSGHTQHSLVVWGYLAGQFRRKWLWVVAVVLVVLIPLSRVYLGVHFPHDLLGGYLIGAALLALYLWLTPHVERWLHARGLAWQLGLAVAVPLVMVLLFPTKDGVVSGATLLGMAVGFAVERRYVGFVVSETWPKRVIGFILGVVVLVGLWMGLRVAFDGLEPAMAYRFVRYGLTGLWGGLGAPWMMVRLRLAGQETPGDR
jgi:membrane-associated phospholipid phosphatase